MKPVKQTIYTETEGNCLAACLATIIENDIEDYPELPNTFNWVKSINNFLHKIGWNLIIVDQDQKVNSITHRDGCLAGLYIMIGFNAKSNLRHAVICKGNARKVIFDPSPFRNENSEPLTDCYYAIVQKILT